MPGPVGTAAPKGGERAGDDDAGSGRANKGSLCHLAADPLADLRLLAPQVLHSYL